MKWIVPAFDEQEVATANEYEFDNINTAHIALYWIGVQAFFESGEVSELSGLPDKVTDIDGNIHALIVDPDMIATWYESLSDTSIVWQPGTRPKDSAKGE